MKIIYWTLSSCILLFFSTTIIWAQQPVFHISSNLGYSSFNSIQNGIPPYYYDIKGGRDLELSLGVKFKEIKSYAPVVEIGIQNSVLRLYHFGGIADTSTSKFFEDQFKINLNMLSLKFLIERKFSNISLLGGVKISKIVSETELRESFIISGNAKRELEKLSSVKNSMKVNDGFFVNGCFGFYTSISNQVDLGIESSYGLSFYRNDKDSDFLARQITIDLFCRFHL